MGESKKKGPSSNKAQYTRIVDAKDQGQSEKLFSVNEADKMTPQKRPEKKTCTVSKKPNPKITVMCIVYGKCRTITASVWDNPWDPHRTPLCGLKKHYVEHVRHNGSKHFGMGNDVWHQYENDTINMDEYENPSMCVTINTIFPILLLVQICPIIDRNKSRQNVMKNFKK